MARNQLAMAICTDMAADPCCGKQLQSCNFFRTLLPSESNMPEYAAAESPLMNGHDESGTSSSTDTSPGKPLTTPKGLPSLNGKHTDSSVKAKADSRSGTPKQAHNDALKALEGTVNDLRVSQYPSACYFSCISLQNRGTR
jgi:hypothetical protein